MYQELIWISKSKHAQLSTSLADLINRRSNIRQEILEISQMDHHTTELPLYLRQSNDLSTLIKHIEYTLGQSTIIEDHLPSDPKVVHIGCVVSIVTTDSPTIAYEIVGYGETNSSRNQLSYTTDLAQSLIGKKLGDLVSITADIFHTIIDINTSL